MVNNNFQSGLLLCSRYAFMPNKLQYCGGDQNATLFELTATNDANAYLNNVLGEFETLYPYLKLIAKENNIRDPFDYRVVEAYWIGNNLLENVKIRGLYNHFVDGLHLKKKMTNKQFELMMGEIPGQALPHHSFHVFNVWLRSGLTILPNILDTMDQCRISWGKIIRVGDLELEVESPRLSMADVNSGTEFYSVQDSRLIFSPPQVIKVQYKMLGESFIENPQIGDWVSIHWGWVCDKLTKEQVKNLEKYTLHNLHLVK